MSELGRVVELVGRVLFAGAIASDYWIVYTLGALACFAVADHLEAKVQRRWLR